MDLVEEELRLGTWPRRLLHVPSMTSHVWREGNTYNGIANPPYNAISYTWGRWRLERDEDPHVKPIDVKGIDWRLPRIRPHHFAPSQFHRAIEAATHSPFRFQDVPSEMLASVDFLWVDVVCIDQRDAEPRFRAEVGRQAGIFDRARHVFIWLSSTSSGVFESFIASTAAFGQLHQDPDEPEWEYEGDDNPRKGRPVETIPTSATVWSLLLRVLDDPWWSSLWTLQEAYMRADAYLLSSNGDLVTFPRPMKPYEPWRLSDLLITYETLRTVCEQATQDSSDPWYTAMQDMYKRKGLRALATRNPLAIYEAATNRETTKEVDRIYGIQQIFNCRVGNTTVEAAEKTCTYSLDDLEEQLGLKLLDCLPVSSQYHVFTQPTTLASQWRLQRHSIVPVEAATYNCHKDEVSGPNMRERCCFTVSAQRTLELRGLAMPLQALLLATRRLNCEPNSKTVLKLYLDASLSNDAPHFIGETKCSEIDQLQSSHAPRELNVICLGVAYGFYSCRIYALLVVAQQLAWKRLGLCYWETFHDRSRPSTSKLSEMNAVFMRLVQCSWQPFCGVYSAELSCIQ
jgi:hypothetical protein